MLCTTPAQHAGHHLPRVDIEQTPRGSGTNITIKALATLTSAAGDASDPARASKLPLFGGLDAARFRRQVVPGDELTIRVELGRMSARAGKGVGTASVQGEVACECELMFVLVDRAS